MSYEAPEIVVENWPVESLVAYARNARTHSKEQIKQIAQSIREFGWTNPVLIDGDGGVIAGHGRIMAAQSLGMVEVPCIVIQGLTPEKKRALVLADNKIALNAGWDESLLGIELQALVDSGYAAQLTGFSDEEIDELIEAATGGDMAGEGEGDGGGDSEPGEIVCCPSCGHKFSILVQKKRRKK